MENQETIQNIGLCPKSDNQYNNLSFGGTLKYIIFLQFFNSFHTIFFKVYLFLNLCRVQPTPQVRITSKTHKAISLLLINRSLKC
jgi:hypothetical protein